MDEIWDLIESVSEGFPSYSIQRRIRKSAAARGGGGGGGGGGWGGGGTRDNDHCSLFSFPIMWVPTDELE